MRYLADLLTLSRLILSIALMISAFLGGSPESAFIIFLIAEITDMFDGTCAREWPFPKTKAPGYRKYAAQFDIVADVLLAAAQVLYLTFRINCAAGVIFITYYILVCPTIEIIVYGKFFGHPDNFTKKSLINRNFLLAKKLVMTRRYLYVASLGIISVFILFATRWPIAVKIILTAMGCFIYIFAWFFLRQRRKNISRDAVDIEKELTAKSKKVKK